MTTGKTIDLTRQTFVNKVMSLLFNMLSRLVISQIRVSQIWFLIKAPEELLKHRCSQISKDSTLISLMKSPAAAAAAKSLQSYPTLCDPIDESLPGSPVPGILQARTLEWVAISFSNA